MADDDNGAYSRIPGSNTSMVETETSPVK